MSNNCIFCTKEFANKGFLTIHQNKCKLNPNRITGTNFDKYLERVRNGEIEAVISNQYIKAKQLGLPKPIISNETREKLSKSLKGKIRTKEQRLAASIAMKLAVERNPESYSSNNVCGRVKSIEYNGTKLTGKWELLVAQWLDSNNISWTNKVTPIEYIWNDKTHLYFPDFYLPDLDLYIEVKGYQRERDLAKWSVVDNLIVIKLTEINLIKSNNFSLAPLSPLAHNQ